MSHKEHHEYPKALYHSSYDHTKPTKGVKIVHNEDEAKELGSDWKATPADHGIVTAPSEDQLDESGKSFRHKQRELKAQEHDLTRTEPVDQSPLQKVATEKTGAATKTGADAKDGVK